MYGTRCASAFVRAGGRGLVDFFIDGSLIMTLNFNDIWQRYGKPKPQRESGTSSSAACGTTTSSSAHEAKRKLHHLWQHTGHPHRKFNHDTGEVDIDSDAEEAAEGAAMAAAYSDVDSNVDSDVDSNVHDSEV